METKHKILCLDDDADWLDMCRDFLAQLPSQPEIRTASTGIRALSMLDASEFRVLICDLKMPRMDGLQVLSIVRRRFPELRTVVLTGLQDDQFRSRAYALGVDLFWLKPDMQQNSQMFLDCIESLLGREDTGGFRDTQTKNLLNVIQMECLAGNSSVLRIISGPLIAKMWFQRGELVDAAAEGADGEAAFRRILKWKSGTFESLPAEPEHVRTITKSLDSLMAESEQGIEKTANPGSAEEQAQQKLVGQLAAIAVEGAEFVVSVPAKKEIAAKGWGTKNTEQLATWTRHVEKTAQRIGETLSAGPLSHIAGHNLERHLLLLPQNGKTFVVSWPPGADGEKLVEQSKKIDKHMGLLKWFSSSQPAVHKLPSGSFTVDRHGNVRTGTVGADCPASVLDGIAEEILSVFREARAAQMPLAEVSLDFAGIKVSARDMQGGAIVFLSPKNPLAIPSPAGDKP